MRILIVEDEPTLRRQLQDRLQTAGHVVDVAADGTEGLYMGQEYPVDLAIVDLGLPKLAGLDLIRRLRAGGRAFPILILTARDRWQDKVEGLEAGADDYLVKPFQMEELLARVNALLRRAGGWTRPVLEAGPVRLDTRSQEVSVAGRPVELTAFEYRLLEYLMFEAGKVVSKSDIAERLYHDDEERDSNTVEVFIGRLRRKLDPDNSLQPIETLRGRGYRFTLR
ncbi:MAG: response regulator transcription factor [Xanthomonadaceae bacterium]|nr:response regulator transcription factor [Xanthomonadaceae bacterium]